MGSDNVDEKIKEIEGGKSSEGGNWKYIIIVIIAIIIIAIIIYLWMYSGTVKPVRPNRTKETLSHMKNLVESNSSLVRMYISECVYKSGGQDITKRQLHKIYKNGILLLISDKPSSKKISSLMCEKLEVLKDVIKSKDIDEAISIDKELNKEISKIMTKRRGDCKQLVTILDNMSKEAIMQAYYMEINEYEKGFEAYKNYRKYSGDFFVWTINYVLSSNGEDDDLIV